MVLNTHKEWMVYKERKPGYITDKSAGLWLGVLADDGVFPSPMAGHSTHVSAIHHAWNGCEGAWEHAVSLSRFPADADTHRSPSDTLTF